MPFPPQKLCVTSCVTHALPYFNENRIDLVHDIFGREKHKLHSDNMGGVGSFEKDCRTLYVGRLGKHKELENILWNEFGEWGEIEVIIGYQFQTWKLHVASQTNMLM